MYKFVAGFALMLVMLGGCKSDLNKTGYDLLLPGALVSPRKAILDKTKMKAFTVTDEIQRTDEPAYNLLGTLNDPVFGKTTADYACQFRMTGLPKFKLDSQIDSMVLIMSYRSFYGDTVTAQKFNAYELTSDLGDADKTKYYQDVDLKAMTNGEKVGSITYYPTHRDSLHSTDSKVRDTITMNIRIKLNESLTKKLVELSLSSLEINKTEPNIPFLQSFKGLYIETEEGTQGGAIMRTHPYAIAIYSRTTASLPRDSIRTTYFDVTSNSVCVSRFVHDYSTTAFAANLDSLDQQDDKIYLQTTGGLASRIFIPELNNWRDSVGCAINKAELIFTVDQAVSDTAKFKPPYQLILSAIGKKVNTQIDSLYFPSDLGFSQAYYGGIYNKKDGTYRFNLAKHMQEFITKSTKKKDISGYLKDNYAFYLSMANRNSSFSRVVLKGATSDVGIRMEITYSKYK